MSTRSQRLANVEKAKHDLDMLEKEYKPTLKDAVMALRVLKATINIRNGTKEDFDINEDDIRVCDAAFDCIMEDIHFDCYLEDSK
tara:strand:- start:27 stop:281 length:255 start_codon:yes stop_codon:yes gene_type:complete